MAEQSKEVQALLQTIQQLSDTISQLQINTNLLQLELKELKEKENSNENSK